MASMTVYSLGVTMLREELAKSDETQPTKDVVYIGIDREDKHGKH